MDDRTIRSVFQDETEKSALVGQDPAEANLSPEDHEKIRQAREIMQALSKTFKSLRLYASENELVVRFRKELADRIVQYFEKFEALEMRIRQTQITLLGQPIYRSQEESENLAQILYNDGLRRITLHTGIPQEEVFGFIDLLKKASERTLDYDHDIVTLFWEKDFKFLTHYAVEEILPEGVNASEIDALADEQIEKIATLNFYADDEALSQFESSFAFEEGEKRQDIFDNTPPSEETVLKTHLASSFLALDPAEIEKIQEQIRNESVEDLFLDMADTIMEIIFHERSFDDFKMLAENLEKILLMFTHSFDLHRATEMLKRIQFLVDGYKQTSAKAAEYLETIILRLATPEKIRGLFTTLSQGDLGTIANLGQFLVQLGPSVIPFVCEELEKTESNDLRKHLCDVLVILGKKNFALLLEKLEGTSEKTIRNKIYILTRIGDERSVAYFRKLIQHPNAAIKQMVIAALARFYNPITRDILTQALHDDNPAVRVTILKTLAQIKDVRTLDAILPFLNQAAFHLKTLAEKREFFSALALIGGNSLTESLGTILLNQNLKDKDKDDEIRLCAAEALGLIASTDSVKVLKAGMKTKRKAIVETCEAQLRKILEAQ